LPKQQRNIILSHNKKAAPELNSVTQGVHSLLAPLPVYQLCVLLIALEITSRLLLFQALHADTSMSKGSKGAFFPSVSLFISEETSSRIL